MRRLQVCVGVLALTFAAGCNKKIDTSKVENLIKTSLETKLKDHLGGQPLTVECPPNMPIEKDDVFECTITAGEHTLIATVTQQDTKGTVLWEVTKGVVEMTIKTGTEDLIAQYIEKNLGVADAPVECPATIEIKKGGEFECSAVIDGVKVTSQVEQQNDEGNVSYNLSGGIVFTEKLGIIVEADLKAKGAVAKVDCGTPLLLSKPGSTFQCKAVDDKGKTATVNVTINDQAGDVTWNLTVDQPAAGK